MIISIKKLFDLGRCSHQCYSIHYWYLYHRNLVLSCNSKTKQNKTKQKNPKNPNTKKKKPWYPPPSFWVWWSLSNLIITFETDTSWFILFIFLIKHQRFLYDWNLYLPQSWAGMQGLISGHQYRGNSNWFPYNEINDNLRWQEATKEEKKKKKDRTTFLTLDQSEDWVLKRESQMIYI